MHAKPLTNPMNLLEALIKTVQNGTTDHQTRNVRLEMIRTSSFRTQRCQHLFWQAMVLLFLGFKIRLRFMLPAPAHAIHSRPPAHR